MRADVAVDDLERAPRAVLHLVRFVQAGAGVGQHAQEHPRRDPEPLALARAVELRERVALDVLHGQVEDLVLLAEVEDLRDVRVLDARGDARFVEEHLLEAHVRRELREDCLDGDELLEAVFAPLPRDPDARHPALGDGAEQLVAIELIARRERRGVEGGARH